MAKARSFLGAGDIYIERFINGVSQGMSGKIYANKFSLQPAVEKVESTSKGRYDYGQVLESVALGQPTELTLELKEVVGDILVMALQGTSSAVSIASGTMTNEVFDELVEDKWVEIGHKNLTGTIVVKENIATPLVTYVEGTDYELNKPLGMIRVLSTGAIDAEDGVKITGAFNATTGTLIKGQTNVDIRCRILFDGINKADGSQCTVDVFEAIISADSEFDFLADDFGNVSLTGTVKTPADKDAPYEVLLQDAA